MKLRPALALLALAAAPAAAQPAAGPGPDLWLAELGRADGVRTVGAPANLTRRAGYDNQPWFLPDGRSLLYVAEEEGQTDVFRLELATGARTQLTRTPEWREYSPRLTADGELLVVRWDRPVENGAAWRYTAAGEPREPLRGAVAQVGYFDHADANTLAAFINDSVQSFVVSDLRTGRVDTAATRIGGSAPQRIPGTSAVSVLTRDEGGAWWITRFDPATRQFRRLVRTLPESTQYVWTRRGSILMARGSTLYEWDPRGGPGWLTVGTLPGVRNVSRLALSPAEDRLVFVAEPAG
jgi:hypothetical protein